MCVLLGMINILHGLGLRLLSLGYHTPFMVSCCVFHTCIKALMACHTIVILHEVNV